MKHLLPTLALASMLMTGLAGHANAYSIPTSTTGTYTLTSPYAVTSYIAFDGITPGTNTGTFALGHGINLSLTNNAKILNVESSNGATAPWGTQETEKPASYHNYLSVYNGGSATLSFTTAARTVSFEWGTIDCGNELLVTTTKGTTYAVWGSDLKSHKLTTGLDQYFTLTDTTGIASLTFLAGGKNKEGKSIDKFPFEIANLNVTAVPLPGALVLFAPALAGLALRRKAKIAA